MSENEEPTALWSTCPDCQERFVPVVNEVHVCPAFKELFGDGVIRNECAWDSILSAGVTSSAIADKIASINRLVKEVCEYKRVHIEARVGYYPHSPGSILNAYREGDLDFDTAVALLKAPELSRYERALIFAARAHGEQKRKYSGEPYIVHPIAVAGMLKDAGLDEDVQIAGVLHDVPEDTQVTGGQIAATFGARVAGLVSEVTAHVHPGMRAARKRKERLRLADASPEAQSIKVADLTDNVPSIAEHDPKFARIYLPEKRALLAVLDRADPNLLRRAFEVLEDGEKKIWS